MLGLCDCREYTVASKRTLLQADFAGPFPGAQFFGIRINEDVNVSVDIMPVMFPRSESIASIRNLRRSDDGGNTVIRTSESWLGKA